MIKKVPILPIDSRKAIKDWDSWPGKPRKSKPLTIWREVEEKILIVNRNRKNYSVHYHNIVPCKRLQKKLVERGYEGLANEINDCTPIQFFRAIYNYYWTPKYIIKLLRVIEKYE